MKLSRSALSLAVVAALVAPAAHAEIAIDVIGGSEVSFEGLLQADGNWFHSDIANLNGDALDGSETDFELRRAELILKGKGPGNIEWVVGYDAKADKFLDTNLKYKIKGNGNHYLQVGQYKQPNSLEELSSTKHNDFISKAMITNTWAVARRLGAAYSVGDANWSVTGSVFTRELTRNLASGNGYGLRATYAPINDKGSVLHFGVSYVSHDTRLDTIRIRTRPNADLSSARLVDTSDLRDADRIATWGLESFWVKGPVKLQGEYMRSRVDRYAARSGDFTGDGWYVSGVWNVTGETWSYKGGVPGTGLPDEPGRGMWQLGARYDRIDLNDGSLGYIGTTPQVAGVLGGEMSAWTVGANWYWRSNFKLSLNYVMVDSSRYIGRSSSTYSLNPANNNRTFNRVVEDDPKVIEARLQFYW